jgi:hypothetical protein
MYIVAFATVVAKHDVVTVANALVGTRVQLGCHGITLFE